VSSSSGERKLTQQNARGRVSGNVQMRRSVKIVVAIVFHGLAFIATVAVYAGIPIADEIRTLSGGRGNRIARLRTRVLDGSFGRLASCGLAYGLGFVRRFHGRSP